MEQKGRSAQRKLHRGSQCGSRGPAGQGPEAGGQDTHVSGFDWEIWGSIKLQCK